MPLAMGVYVVRKWPLRGRIRFLCWKNIDAPMLTRVWQELEYCINDCCVTRGAQVEHI
jgi:hypothetical protein